jgi:hypothetical protein
METMVVVNGMTAHRANVIMARTGSAAMGIVKAQMIDLLKEKLRNGVAHFIFVKKNGEVREALGTTNAAVAAKYTNGNGCSREYFKTTAYFDIEKGEWRSFRWESLVKVF